MASIEVKYLTPNDEYALLDISSSEGSDTVGILVDKEVWKKEILSVSGVPEFKMDTCYQSVRIPFDGRTEVPYPCASTRSSKHWMELKVSYPSDIAQDAKDKVIKCALEAAAYAAGIIAVGVVAPGAIPALIPAAKAAFALKFSECLEEGIRNTIDIEITHESSSGDWSRV